VRTECCQPKQAKINNEPKGDILENKIIDYNQNYINTHKYKNMKRENRNLPRPES
jgi:hypothetical protein